MAPHTPQHHNHSRSTSLSSNPSQFHPIPVNKNAASVDKKPHISSSLPTTSPDTPRTTTTADPPVYLSRRFVARRISEGETGRLKEELKCQACGKGYKHISSLAKHLWEHTPEWNMTSKLLISKHQQVKLLEAASILVSMNEESEQKPEKPCASVDRSVSRGLDSEEDAPSEYAPSLAEDSTPSPPPQPQTPQFTGSFQPAKSKNTNTHSRSSSLTHPTTNFSPYSSSVVTDSLYLPNTDSGSVLSGDAFQRRKSFRHYSFKSNRRPSALSPPNKINTRLLLDSDDLDDDDNENAVMDDLEDDDGVFGRMD